MKKRMLLTFIFAGIVCLIFVSIQKSEAAKPIFFADFDGKGIPDNSVNDAGNWKAENPANTWGIGDFPANGTKALKMTAGGCGSSGFTPFPTVENWTDGIIQIDLGWNDDDSWGIMFRRKDETTGYFAFFGYIETLSLALFDLAEGCGPNGKCLSETGCEQGPDGAAEAVPDKAIKAVPHNLPGTLKKVADTSYTARILADGPKIKIWYGLTKDFPDDPLKEPKKVASMIEVEDSTYTKGSVGIWQESNDNGVIDNIYVFDKSALAVSPQGKTAITWGTIKER
ncbi:MAG: hypothetical protein ACE5PV_19190 [Candidatus Poribacteria bacterium]